MDFYSLFYWLVVADNAKAFFITFIVIFTAISIIATLVYLFNFDDQDVQIPARRWVFWALPFSVIFWALFIFTPSKKDALIIIAGGAVGNFVTQDSTAKGIPKDVMKLLSSKIKTEIAETDLKSALLGEKDTLQEMSKEQLIQKLKEKHGN